MAENGELAEPGAFGDAPCCFSREPTSIIKFTVKNKYVIIISIIIKCDDDESHIYILQYGVQDRYDIPYLNFVSC